VTRPRVTLFSPNARECFRARNRRATRLPPRFLFSLSLSLSLSLSRRIQIYEGTTSGQPSRATRASPSLPAPIDLPSYRCALHEGVVPPTPPSFRNKKKKESQERKKSCSFPSTRHMARCAFFFSLPVRGAGSPITVPSPFFRRFLKSWIPPPPSPRPRRSVQRPARARSPRSG